MTDSVPGQRQTLARDAYIYGYPLVENIGQVRRYVTEGVGANPVAPFNTFSHARELAGPADTFVTINNDTLYSMAQIDLSVGPVLLTVPATGSRYYVLQIVDAWTNNIAYVGTRATGNDAGTFVIVPPGFAPEQLPADATPIQASTRILSIVGRIACAGPDDIAAVNALQDQFALSPADPTAAALGLPDAAGTGDVALDFFEDLRVLCGALPALGDSDYAEQFTELGLAGDAALTEVDPALADDLRGGHSAGVERVEYLSKHGASPVIDGWTVGLHLFDYNIHALGLGTVDEPQWKLTDPALRFPERAVATRVGLWGNHAYEAVYAQAFTDIDGHPLHGTSTYQIHFATEPPVGAFWSVTLYDVPRYFLVDNPIDRYSLGDRTPGIVRNDDGTLTVTVAHAEPDDPTRRANWLPAPDANFRLVLRLYIPGPEVLAGTYAFPRVEQA